MIHQVLPFIAKELNTFFKLKYGVDEDLVVVSGLVDMHGNAPTEEENKILLSVINIEEEKLNRARATYVPAGESGGFSKRAPAIKINLQVMFTANFAQGNYLEGLKLISGVIGFFQRQRTYDGKNYPTLDDSIEKLSFEITSLDVHKLNQLWGTVGNKYQPSVIYKVKTLEIQEDTVGREVTEISGF
ncbi:MAG: DUF4255 domain-containing protein [Bacteroidota bacterium]